MAKRAHPDLVPRHPMRLVIRRTGLTPARLRIWERRYGVVRPGRTGGGQRLYSEDDLRQLDTEVLAVSSDTPEQNAASLRVGKLGFRLLSDPRFENARRFKSYDDFEELALHSTILVDREGRVRWARSGGPLAINEVRDGALQPAAGWEKMRLAIAARIGEIVAGIRQGAFPVFNEDKDCATTCTLRTVCRIAHIRSLDKRWPTAPHPTP